MNIIPFPGPDHKNERKSESHGNRADSSRLRWVEVLGQTLVIVAGCWSLMAALGSIATFARKSPPSSMTSGATNREAAPVPLASTATTNGQNGIWTDSISISTPSRVATNTAPAKPRTESQTTAG